MQAEDTGGLLYSTLLKPWIHAAGASEAALRLPGLLLLLALMAVLARAATLLSGRWAGICAAWVALAHPSVLPAARQARGYILLLVLAAVALLGIAEWASNRRRRGAWLAALAGLGAAATHVFGVFVALGAGAALAWLASHDNRADAKSGALRAGAVAAPGVLFVAPWTVLIGERVRQNVESFWIGGSAAAGSLAIGAWLVAPLAAAVAWLCWRHRSKTMRRAAAALVLFAVPAAIGPGLVSALLPGETHFVTVRYALALVPPAILAAALAVSLLPRRAAVPLLAVALAASLGYSAARNVYSEQTRNGQDTRGAGAFLRDRVAAGDVLFVEPASNWLVLEYYGVHTVPAEGQPPGWRVATGAAWASRGAWLVRFSERSVLGPGDWSRAAETRRFGRIVISRVPPP